MNVKLLGLLISITAWGLATPVRAAVSRGLAQQNSIHETQHLVCVREAQHWSCSSDKSQEGDREAENDAGAVQQAEVMAANKSSASAKPQSSSSAEQRSIANIFIWCSYLLPCGLGLGLYMHHRYRIYCTAVLQKQIETLERLWRYSPDNDATTDSGTEASS